jgi:hypothetical protein
MGLGNKHSIQFDFGFTGGVKEAPTASSQFYAFGPTPQTPITVKSRNPVLTLTTTQTTTANGERQRHSRA